MREKLAKTVEIPLTAEGVEAAYIFIEEGLKRDRINKEILSETMLVFEALFHNLVEQHVQRHIRLTVTKQKSIGEIYVKLGFEGKAYVPPEHDPSDDSPESRILRAYHEKIVYRYGAGHNTIGIILRRSYSGFQMRCYIGIALAILVGLPLYSFTSVETRTMLDEEVLHPLIKMFSNAMLMVGAPITLFSMIRNMTDVYIVAERSSSGRRLQIKTLITSAVSVVLAFFVSAIAAFFLGWGRDYLEGYGQAMSFREMVESLVPSNILEPFQTLMPFPMVIIALLITYSFCSVGEYFDQLRKGVDICYALFSKMLNVVMGFLPFFCFLAFLTPLIVDGWFALSIILAAVLLTLGGLSALFVFYALRLRIGGVKLGPFLKKLPPLLWENLKINSAIDAVPFNIRYCARNYGFNRKRLSENLPILAQANLDGNCFIIMMLAMLMVFMMGIDISWLQILAISILVFFLSFGAPNQPGSILIGTLIIIYYLKAGDLISFAIYMEVFLGSIQNAVNVIGDIVTVAIDEQKSV